MDISVVVPLFNEAESLPELISWIDEVMKKNNFTYEVVLINDGSRDNSWEVINQLSQTNKNVKGLRFRRNYGKSAALHCGFQEVKGRVVITMDADLQDSPDEIPGLYHKIVDERYDLVSGWKKKRYDNAFTKNLPSKLYNWTARRFSGIHLHDFNCGLKAYRLEVVKSIEVFGEMHRYMPFLAKAAGFHNIGEQVVQHRKRKYGTTKFGMNRFVNGMLDLLTITFITKFAKKPMHLFGLLGLLFFFIGTAILVYLSMGKIFFMQYRMVDRPLFYFGLLSFLFGSQLFLTGFLAELISRSSADRNSYLIDEKINL